MHPAIRTIESVTIPAISPILSPPVSSVGPLSVVTFAAAVAVVVVVVAMKHHEK